MLVNTFLASLAAKLAMATGLAVATVTAAGAAGVLPEPAQNAVASVVEATTPFALPHAAADEVVGDVDDPTTTTLGTSTTIAGDDEDDDDGTTDGTRKENHGLCVSTVAKNTPGGPDHGKTVSSVARSDCGKKSATTSTTVAPTTSTTFAPTTSSTSTTVAGVTSSNSGKGNSGNSANSGKGNSGKN
jgi:hypothetical protein